MSAGVRRPSTPPKPTKPAISQTPRLKKKVPWKGKSIMVHLPRDEGRGQPGKPVKPLGASDTAAMLRSWEQLGYSIRGFDLEGHFASRDPSESYSQSRNQWPDPQEIDGERSQRKWKVMLPDLNAWKNYVDEVNEAKLRALGVSFGDDDPAPPSISPAPSNLSRQPSNQFPPLPFSPPIPTSSAASVGLQGFPFPGAFHGTLAAHSPTIPSVPSPASFNHLPRGLGKFNPRASISISPHELPFHFPGQPSPRGWSPQSMHLQHQLARGGSPSLHNFNSLMSPTSPFLSENIPSPLGMHQRHQSLQYPMLPHQQLQRRDSARASPRLQELREDDEETRSNPYEKSPSKTPEPGQFIKHNASASLQKEIDDAEYHLEEQFREQLEHEDYSPHNESEKAAANKPADMHLPLHTKQPSVHFGGFCTDSDDGPVLHHPQPHNRGHSLSQQPFFENDEVRDSTDEGSVRKKPGNLQLRKADETFEIETNPSNLGTSMGTFDLVNKTHDRSFSTASNPWADVESQSQNDGKAMSHRPSHASKPSLSKLNAGALEFKFNPESSFTPGQFNFGKVSSFQPTASAFQPPTYQPSTFTPNPPQSATSSHFSMHSTSSSKAKINACAPVFSPGSSNFNFTGKSNFNFSASGPRFNPVAPTFQPLKSLPPSVTSGTGSGNESANHRTSSIFSNIDLNLPDVVKPANKSKAIPIVRPVSSHSPAPAAEEIDEHGRTVYTSRQTKKFRENSEDNDDIPRFAEPTPEPEPVPVPQSVVAEEELAVKAKQEDDDENAIAGTTTLASTVISESTDGKMQSDNGTKATTSPSATSPDHNWTPFEFSREKDVQDFNNARPFGDDEPSFKKAHKKSLSAAAKPFVPSGFAFGSTSDGKSAFDASPKIQSPVMAKSEESEDDRAASPTPGPEPRPIDAAAEDEEAPVSSPDRSRRSSLRTEFDTSRFAAPSMGLGASRFASPPPVPAGLAASRFAKSPSPEAAQVFNANAFDFGEPTGFRSFNESVPAPVSPPSVTADEPEDDEHEPTFEEIDAVMQQLNSTDPTMGVNRAFESTQWHQSSPVRNIPITAVTESTPVHLPPQSRFRSDAPSPSPRQHRTLPLEPAPPILSREVDDPFLDPQSAVSQNFQGSVHNLNVGDDIPESEWDDAFSASEQGKLEQRVTYFDGHVNDLVGNLLADRLEPLEKTLGSIQHVLASLSTKTPSTRHNRRSVSAEIQESDADDEDDESPAARRSMSPKRDKRMEQMRFAVMEALNQHQASRALQQAVAEPLAVEQQGALESTAILKALEDMRDQFGQSLRLDFRGEDLRNIVEEAVENRMPPTPPPVVKDDEEATRKMSDMQNRILELEQRLRAEGEKVEKEIIIRREAEDRAAELRRQLDQAEVRVEVEIINRSVFDQRVHDLEERLKTQEDKTEHELRGRREAEDRLSEIQRLLRISSEEEDRLRSELDERNHQMKVVEQTAGKNNMRLVMLEAAQTNAEETHAELTSRLNASDEELRGTRNEARHWRSEAEHAREASRRQTDDFIQAVEESKHLRKVIDTLGTQLQETERIRDAWRKKFASMQDDMAHAAHEITEENSQRTKKEQTLLARQEVLEARLQAESRTRERLETELERLEGGERAGMRAVSECKRLEGLLTELRNENHQLQQNALRFQREYQEARESAAAEVQRARTAVQSELEAANDQVNVARAELEEEVIKIRAQLDQVRMDADTANAHHEMMLEEAQNSKTSELDELIRKHQNEVEDLQARYERQINNSTEDAQRAEQNLLERLSLSTSKTEHLQDRVAHLEDKLQIAQEAARAAALAAKSAGAIEPISHAAAFAKPTVVAQSLQLPEKISPQALRESIMVLQEQLQAREQRIEELEQTVSKLDPEAEMKIMKRDDEITWLRELLAVRHGDLQDIIGALSAEKYDREAVKDAAIRLNANLQMEEQERERAMNGGSAINLPNIAATIRGAATPRVAQAVGPLAAAWGNWRKANLSPAPARNSTPSRSNITISPASQSSFLSGLMTPPASGLRNTPSTDQSKLQPTAFGNTGRRMTGEQFANRVRGSSMTSRQADKMPMAATPPPPRLSEYREPVTPPMMRQGVYDSDAPPIEDFDDAGFFDD
ncbi:uncharacterized protein BCR38DRAFT_337123 [Pseudomassariella vexata]|uniref:Myosin class II heavy chain n=1 Tax=Pseudomassariella vexata TaxID=1141098 RepID=A0A1Y2E753_9PEZI|nr:uncharacterized protein BCR38DRAFT_337123 [Pseudomassariella vexata]ORY67403.1 hypothetical protein BCR38DRAFT_337123 [Pseudomassariella vexata]